MTDTIKFNSYLFATCANGEPNVVPVAFKDVADDVFLETTLANIKANNGKIAISVYDAQNLEGYQIKGIAKYVTEGAVLASTLKELTTKGIIDRKSYDEIPPRVEYTLTERGKTVIPILQSICHWAGIFYKEDSDMKMAHCEKCDYK